MKNLDHVKIELEEKRADIKSIDEHEWSDKDIISVRIVCEQVSIIFGNENYQAAMDLNDEDLAVLANAKGFYLVKRGDTNE